MSLQENYGGEGGRVLVNQTRQQHFGCAKNTIYSSSFLPDSTFPAHGGLEPHGGCRHQVFGARHISAFGHDLSIPDWLSTSPGACTISCKKKMLRRASEAASPSLSPTKLRLWTWSSMAPQIS
jgi:hypothetical protein